MKKLVSVVALTMVSFGFGATAQAANVFDQAGDFKTMFGGVEFAYDAVTGEQITDPGRIANLATGQLGTGFKVTGLLTATAVSSLDGPGGQDLSYLYPMNGEGGSYVAFLDNLYAATANSANVNSSSGANIYFTGGTIHYYFVPNMNPSDFLGIEYSANGLKHKNGNLIDFSDFELIAEFALSSNVEYEGNFYTGSSNVKFENGNIHAETNLYADVLPGYSAFDTNLYGLSKSDMHISATLDWPVTTGKISDRFTVAANSEFSRNAVPEPTALVLFGAGLAGLAALGRRRKDV